MRSFQITIGSRERDTYWAISLSGSIPSLPPLSVLRKSRTSRIASESPTEEDDDEEEDEEEEVREAEAPSCCCPGKDDDDEGGLTSTCMR